MAQTPLLVKPTQDMCRLQAAKIGLPQREADKFWLYYDSNGWRVGRTLMRNWHSAMAGWKMRYEERIGAAAKSIMQKDLDRQLDREERSRR